MVMRRPSPADDVPVALKLARKYKAMGLPVQRRNAVQSGLFYRKVGIRSWEARAMIRDWIERNGKIMC